MYYKNYYISLFLRRGEDKMFIIEKDKISYVINKEVVAYVLFSKDTSSVNILSTFVKPEFRNKKIASKLLSYLVNYFEHNGFSILSSCSYATYFLEKSKNSFQ